MTLHELSLQPPVCNSRLRAAVGSPAHLLDILSRNAGYANRTAELSVRRTRGLGETIAAISGYSTRSLKQHSELRREAGATQPPKSVIR